MRSHLGAAAWGRSGSTQRSGSRSQDITSSGISSICALGTLLSGEHHPLFSTGERLPQALSTTQKRHVVTLFCFCTCVALPKRKDQRRISCYIIWANEEALPPCINVSIARLTTTCHASHGTSATRGRGGTLSMPGVQNSLSSCSSVAAFRAAVKLP